MVDKTSGKGATLELQPEYVSNGSSLGGEHFYDAADAFENSHASAGCSSSYCSATSSRFESGGAGTLLPTQKAVELMAALASADSSNDAYFSAARSGSVRERNTESSPLGFVVLDEGAPGGTLGLDSFDINKKGRKSTNPFDEENLNNTADELTPTTSGNARRQWHSHQPPPRMVVMDISSAETTPVQTPTDMPANSISGGGGAPAAAAAGGADEGGSTSLWGGRSPSPSPLPPPRPHSRGDFSIATNTNPFVTANGGSLIDSTLCTNPFVTANSGSPLNPFPPDNMEAVAGKEEGSSSIERVSGGDAEAAAVVAAGGAAAVAAAGRTIESVVAVTACGAEGKISRKPTPPPLPPRTPTPSRTAAQQAAVGEAFCSWRQWSRRQNDSGRPSDNTSVSTSGSSSVGSDKFLIVDKDTGQKYDAREKGDVPADAIALLPSKMDLIELERHRSGNDNTKPIVPSGSPRTPVPAASGSPRTPVPAALTSSMTAVVGNPSSRREKVKKIGGIFRKGLGKVASAAGAAAAAANTRSGGGGDSVATAAKGESGGAKLSSGTPGDRGSGGIGAAARAALAGIRVSLKGKETQETLAGMMLFQELKCHEAPIWVASFNQSGRFLATAGQDAIVLLHKVGDVAGDVGVDASAGDGATPAAGAASGASSEPGPGADLHHENDSERTSSSWRPGLPGICSSGKATGDAFSATDSVGDASNASARDRSPGAEAGESERPTHGSVASDDEGISASGSGRDSGRKNAAAVVIDTTPWQIFKGHTADVLALSWSRNDFLLSASLDKTVRLWHTTRASCLHFFQHVSIVTSVDFHPQFEHFFLSGCFDKKIRVWNIRSGRVQEWQQTPHVVTAAKFSIDGKMIVAGNYVGQVIFYLTEGMRYFTQIDCRSRRFKKKRGRKVSGFAFMNTRASAGPLFQDPDTGTGNSGLGGVDSGGQPSGDRSVDETSSPVPSPGGERSRTASARGGSRVPCRRDGWAPSRHMPEHILVTTNDSRVRLYNTDDFEVNAKFKGFRNDKLQISASFSEDGKQVITGSEDGKVYVWKTGISGTSSTTSALPETPGVLPKPAAPPLPPAQKATNRSYESFSATSAEPPCVLTTASFVPESTSRAFLKAVLGELSEETAEAGGYCGCMILATDYHGVVRVYLKSALLLNR